MSKKYKMNLIKFVFSSLVTLTLSSCQISPPPTELSSSSASLKEDTKSIGSNENIIHNQNCLMRCPTGTPKDNLLVDHEIILLSSNKTTKFADWVAYKVTADAMSGPERKRNWAKDPKIDAEFTFIPHDYKDMSKPPYFFDRGHQAPLASFKGHPKWFVVNYLSNITPQKKDLNQGPWNKLENAERKLIKENGETYILTGPYYDSSNMVHGPILTRITYIVPSGYWKVIMIKKGDEIKTVSFIFPQNTPRDDNYCRYLAPMSQIEKDTGLKFFQNKKFLKEFALKNEIGCGRIPTSH